MQKVKKHIGIRIFFLVLFMGYFADITFFTHSHTIHGVTIVHSHFSYPYPANKDAHSSSQHTHSTKALILIAHAQAWHGLEQTFPELPVMTCSRHITYYTETTATAEQIPIPHFYLRGPPVKTL